MTKFYALLVLCAAIAISFPIGCGGNHHFSEEARVTSPNGALDAVIIREDGGDALSGFEWHAFIVAKGSAVDVHKSNEIFRASSLTDEKLVRSQPHLLEIHYDAASIEQFRNLWGLYEIQSVGSQGERDYLVEIRLAPASLPFSLLTPDGGFKSKEKKERTPFFSHPSLRLGSAFKEASANWPARKRK
jgi:hypothetical protein